MDPGSGRLNCGNDAHNTSSVCVLVIGTIADVLEEAVAWETLKSRTQNKIHFFTVPITAAEYYQEPSYTTYRKPHFLLFVNFSYDFYFWSYPR